MPAACHDDRANSSPLTPRQEAARARLLQVSHRGGIAVLCGPAGTGKTLLLSRLARELSDAGGVVTLKEARRVEAGGPVNGIDVLLLDDAHLAPDAGWLSDVVGRAGHCTTIVLAGQGRLLTLLARGRPLEEQVCLRAVLGPWTRGESDSYIAAALPCLAAAGDAELRERMHELAAGTPRHVVRLVEAARLVITSHPGHRLTTQDLETFQQRLFLEAA
jgi:hypothetical protein